MHSEQFNQIVDEQLDACRSMLVRKAEEYAGPTDRLHNFKVAAELQCTSTRRALSGMMAKHTVSIFDLCEMPHTEADLAMWTEKITDHINYLLLLKAVVIEDLEPKPKHVQSKFDINIPADPVVYN